MFKISVLVFLAYLFGIISGYGFEFYQSTDQAGANSLVKNSNIDKLHQDDDYSSKNNIQSLALTDALVQSGSVDEVLKFDRWDLSYTPAFDHIKVVYPELYERVIYSMGEFLLSELFIELTKVDPSEASLVLLQIPAGELRNTLFNHLLVAWRHSDIDALFTWLHELGDLVPDAVFNDDVYDTLLFLAETNPQKVEENLDLIGDLGSREDVLFALANGWAKHNIDDALNWLASLDSNVLTAQLRQSLAASIIASYAADSPRAAAKLLADQNSHEMSQQLTPMIIESISRESVDEAFLMLQEIDDVKIRAISLFRLAEGGLCSPERLLNTLISDPDILRMGDQGGVLLATVVDSIAAQSPELIAREINGFPLQLQAEVASYTAAQWFEQDSEAALAWLDSGLQADAYDRAASEIVFLLGSQDAYQAFDLATTISSAASRVQALNGIISSASARQLEYFINKIEDGDFSDDERIRLVQKIEKQQAMP